MQNRSNPCPVPRGSGLAILALTVVWLALFPGKILAMTEADCRACHATTADRHHQLILTKGYDCSKCHPVVWDPIIKINQPQMTRDCPTCHVGFDHKAAHDKAVTPVPGCTKCHTSNVVTTHEIASPPVYCLACHASSEPRIMQTISDGIAGTTVVCSNCHLTMHKKRW